MGRKQDLETKIRQSQALIQKYEDIVQTSSDPKEKARARREIDEQWELIRGWWHEYLSLSHRLGVPIHDDIAQIGARFSELPKPIKQTEQRVQVQLILEGDIPSFTQERQMVLQDALAGILHLSPDDIRILNVVAGSVVVVLELPQAAADRLLSLHQSKELVMPGFQVETVKILAKSTPRPKPAPSPLPWQTWLFAVALLADLILVFILGWRLIGDNPNLLAYLQVVFSVVAVIVALLVAFIALRHRLLAEEILYKLGTDRRVQVAIVVVTGLLMYAPSVTPAITPTPTPILTQTPTSTPTPTATSTSTPTTTPTFTPTATSSPTTTPTPTVSPTVTPTLTATSTAMPTATVTFTPTPTSSPTSTWTPTASPTLATVTPTPTRTATTSPTPCISVTSTPIPMALIVQQCEASKFEGNGGSLSFPETGCDVAQKPDAIKLQWDVSRSESYAGCEINLPPEFASVAQDNTHLVLWVHGEKGGEQFLVGLAGSDGGEEKEIVPPIPVVGCQISIPLAKFVNGGVDLAQLNKLIIAFEYYLGEGSRRGSICIGEIGFGSP